MANATKLKKEDREKIANRINYFRTLPNTIRKMAGDLEHAEGFFNKDFVDHEIKSVLVGGRIMILNCS